MSKPTISTFSVTKGGKVEATYAVFQEWDLDLSLDANLQRMRETNPILAPTDKWLKEMRRIFRARFGDLERHESLIRLAQGGLEVDKWSPLLLWHLCYRELLLSDFLETWLYPRKQEGFLRVQSDDVKQYLVQLQSRGLLDKEWSENTINRMASGLPSYAADFRLLQGGNIKEISPYHLPEEAFLYVVYDLAGRRASGAEVISSPDWGRFLMGPQEVERELLQLQRRRRLQVDMAGSVVSITLPYADLDEYVATLVE